MRRESPSWLACTSDSGALRVSPRLKSAYLRAMAILKEDDHVCPVCLFDAVADLLAVDELVEVTGDEMGQSARHRAGRGLCPTSTGTVEGATASYSVRNEAVAYRWFRTLAYSSTDAHHRTTALWPSFGGNRAPSSFPVKTGQESSDIGLHQRVS